MSKIKSLWVGLNADDGTVLNAWFSEPTDYQEAKGGLLMFQEAFGVNAHIRDVTDRFAALGFAAIAYFSTKK